MGSDAAGWDANLGIGHAPVHVRRGVADDRQGIAQLVAHARGELSDCRELLGARSRILRLLELRHRQRERLGFLAVVLREHLDLGPAVGHGAHLGDPVEAGED